MGVKTMSNAQASQQSAQSVSRPAEKQQIQAITLLREELIAGFPTRSHVLLWLNYVSVYNYGQVKSQLFRDFARQFWPDQEYNEGPTLAAFLTEDARTRPMDQEAAEWWREQWAADVLTPSQDAGFRSIRKDATEYMVDSTDDGAADADADSNLSEEPVGFRDSLDELLDKQQKTLVKPLAGELDMTDNRQAILEWGDDVLDATRGEPILKGLPVGEFIQTLHNHPSGDRIMGSTAGHWQRFRQWLLCRFILPAFNRAVQDLSKRSKEEPPRHEGNKTGETPPWEDY